MRKRNVRRIALPGLLMAVAGLASSRRVAAQAGDPSGALEAGAAQPASGSEVRGSEKLAARVESPPPHAAVAEHSNSEPGTLARRPIAREQTVQPRTLQGPPSVAPTSVLPVELKGDPDAPWLRAANSAAPEARPASSTTVASPAAPARAQYTGERISVNLKDVDLTDFFRLIHEVSGLNVIVDPNVSGKLTLVLDAVPWDQALDIVLKNNGLGKTLDGNVLRIAKLATLELEEGASARLEQARLEAGPLVTVVRPLKYARAVDTQAAQSTIPGIPPQPPLPGLATILKSLQGVLSKRGEVVAEPRNNAIIIMDVRSQIPIIESVVDQLDVKPMQISIEAKVVAATTDFVRDLESALSGAFTNRSTATGGTTGSGAAAQGNIPPASGITLAQTLAAGFGALAISNQSSRYFINAAIAAAETRDQLRLISSPSIITQNNVLGKVAQGIEVPYQTTINNTISTQFKDATLELDVTPQVTQDGNVFLMLYVQDDTVGAPVPGLGTSINHQSATTQVVVPDGGTVIFGGIKLARRTRTVTQVPVLGNVPVVGNLFKSSQNSENDQELIFFVTPKILPGGIPPAPEPQMRGASRPS